MRELAAIVLTMLALSPQFQVGQVRQSQFTQPNFMLSWKTCGDSTPTSGCTPTSSTSVFDSTGHGNGVWAGTACGTSGYYSASTFDSSYAGCFDGSTTSISSTTLPLANNNNFTYSMWVYISGTSLKGQFYSDSDSSGGIGIGVGSGTFDTAGNELIVIYSTVVWCRSSTNIGTGWHQIVLTRDGTTTKAFIDSVQTGALQNQSYPFIAPANYQVLGNDRNTTGGRAFNGLIKKLRIFNVARTQAQINSDYAALL